jgi:hypothetical protein
MTSPGLKKAKTIFDHERKNLVMVKNFHKWEEYAILSMTKIRRLVNEIISNTCYMYHPSLTYKI